MSTIDAKHYLLQVRLLRDKVPSFEEYPFCLPAVRHLDTLTLHPAVTFIVGENGTGKSTLLEAIAVAWGFNPEGGTRNFNSPRTRRIRTSTSPCVCPNRLDGHETVSSCGRRAISMSLPRLKQSTENHLIHEFLHHLS